MSFKSKKVAPFSIFCLITQYNTHSRLLFVYNLTFFSSKNSNRIKIATMLAALGLEMKSRYAVIKFQKKENPHCANKEGSGQGNLGEGQEGFHQ